METQNNEFLLNLKRQEFKSRREDVKETFKIRCAEAQHDLQHQMSEAYRMTEANLRKERDEALAMICEEEDRFNIEWATEKARRNAPVRTWINDKGEVNGVAVYLGDMHFKIYLRDMVEGAQIPFTQVEYQHLLPTERMMRVFGLYRKEINALMEQNGGEPLEGWFWTRVDANDIYGEGYSNQKIIFNGDNGDFGPAYMDQQHHARAFELI